MRIQRDEESSGRMAANYYKKHGLVVLKDFFLGREGFHQGLKYRFLRIYQYFNFTDISEISKKYLWNENYLKLIEMLEKTSKNDKISKNTHFKVIL